MNNIFSPIQKYLLFFIRWFLSIYITLYAMCFYVHVNESNIIASKADVLITQITHNKSNLSKVSSVQNMVRKTKPSFLKPNTIIWSLFGKREPYILIIKLLGNAIESRKAELAGITLGQVELEAADLSKANMHGVNLKNANLSEANLEGANLITAKLNFANLHGANLLNTNLYKADFSNTILIDANLEHAQGITCAQIKSAMFDEKTRFPDYISLEGSTESDFKCVNSMKGTGMELSRINLANALLTNADFSKSNLSHTNFLNARISHANFHSANLTEANLSGSNLTNSTFSKADLTGTNLKGAIIKGANLELSRGITCVQIKSAVFEKNTRLPNNISMMWTSEKGYQCKERKIIDFSKLQEQFMSLLETSHRFLLQ